MKSGASLAAYTNVKLRLASILETLLHFSHERKDDQRARLIQELLGDLADDNFRLAVFGKYNRGKSTLMNALLGMERLPTGILPLTSVVTTVRYDSREHVQIFREASSLPHEISIPELPQYVTENGNPSNEKGVSLAQVFLPAEILRYGFFLIDTPGMGSSIAANTRAAENFIPRADAAIVVMSVESPLDEEDWSLLERVRGEVGKVFVVVNKTDLLPEQERRHVIGAVVNRVQTLYRNEMTVFPVSARDAVARIATGDVQANGDVQALMQALLAFIKEEKAGQFLKRMAERIRSLIRDERAMEYLTQRDSSHKQRLIQHIHEQAGVTVEAGMRELQALTDAANRKSFDAVRSSLFGDPRKPSHPLSKTGSVIPLPDLLPEFSSVRERLEDFVGHLREALPSGLLTSADEHRIGRSLENTEVTLAPVSWRAVDRFWMWLGVASAPLLRRLLLQSAFDRHWSNLLHDAKQILTERIQLLEGEFVRKVNSVLEHVDTVLLRNPKSGHGRALDKLTDELQAACAASEARSGSDTFINIVSDQTSFVQGGCAVCELLTNIQFHFIRQYQYKLSIDPEERMQNAQRGGLCAFHTWMYESISSPQGVCTGYALVPQYIADEIERCLQHNGNGGPDRIRERWQKLIRGFEQCIACDVLKTAESDKMKELVSDDGSLPHVPLCVPHLYKLVLSEPPPASAETLFAQMSTRLRRLAEDMQQFALKHTGLRHGWTSSQERTAHVNALVAMVGARQLSYIKTVVEI